MKANQLLQQLSKSLPLTSGNRILPITGCIKFNGTDTFSATDMRNYIDIQIPDTGLNTPFCVDASKFTNILKGFGDNELKFKVTEQDITIKADTSKYKLPIESASDFPIIKGEFTNEKILKGNELNQVISSTAFAVSRDELRPEMTGIYFDNNNVVSTDGHRLVKAYYEHGLNFILPISSFLLINQNITDSVNISDNDSHVRIVLDNVTIHSRKIEERYPPYESVIPTSHNKTFTFNVSELETVVKRLLLTASTTTSAIVFDFNGTDNKAYSSDTDYNVEGIEQLQGVYNGDPLKIGFNGKYMAECLRSINDIEVTLELTESGKACVLRCDGKIILLMPVRVD